MYCWGSTAHIYHCPDYSKPPPLSISLSNMYEVQPIEIGDAKILELDDDGLYEGCIQMKKVSKYHRKKTIDSHTSCYRMETNIGPYSSLCTGRIWYQMLDCRSSCSTIRLGSIYYAAPNVVSFWQLKLALSMFMLLPIQSLMQKCQKISIIMFAMS